VEKNKKKKKKRSNFFKYYFYVSIIFIVFVISIVFNLGFWETYKKEFFYRIHSNGMINYIHLPEIIYSSLKKNFYSYEAIYVNLNQKNKIKIEKNRLDKLNFVNSTNATNYKADYGYIKFVKANASISIKNETIDTKIRLKGDRSIHYRYQSNSSYKFNIKGKNTFKGAKKFSLQKPRIRNYLHEWIYHEMLGEGDLLRIKYDFLYFFLNGENMGLYVFEEGFGKELVERNKRRNGPIFGVQEQFAHSNTLSKLKFEVYDKKDWVTDENIEVVQKGMYNLKELNNNTEYGELEKNFDIKKWAWFFAVTDLTYTEHGAAPKSVKFYFNPITGKIEPIGYDGHRSPRNFSKHLHDFDHRLLFDRTNDKIINDFTGIFLDKFFYIIKDGKRELNEIFYEEYVKALYIITSKEFIDNFLETRKKEISKISSAINADSFVYDDDFRRDSGIGLYYFNKKDLYFRAKKIRNILTPKENLIFITEDEENITIIHSENVRSQGKLVDGKWSQTTNLTEYSRNFKISGFVCDETINKVTISKNISSDIKINFPLTVLNKKKLGLENFSCNFIVFENILNNSKTYKNIDKININFLPKNINQEVYKKYFVENNNNLYLAKKIIEIPENLLIPENYNVIINENEKIILTNSAFIFSNSPWQIGGKNGMTYIQGKKDNFGGGILIRNTDRTSKMVNVRFSYLSGLSRKKLSDNSKNTITSYNENEINSFNKKLTVKNNYIINNYVNNLIVLGSLNFYEADVEMNNIEFNRISSEDAINIFRSDFKINNFKANESFSDAIDIDFSNGEIESSEFKDIGNDAIDLSGSDVKINEISFKNIGDKLISVGEESTADITNIKAINSYVGIVSKDGSITKAKNINMKNVSIGFSSYQKKSAYNIGMMDLNNIVMEKTFIKYLTDEKSIIRADGDYVGIKSNQIIPIIYNRNLDILENISALEE